MDARLRRVNKEIAGACARGMYAMVTNGSG